MESQVGGGGRGVVSSEEIALTRPLDNWVLET